MGTCTSPLKSKLRRKPFSCPSRYKFREISQTILRLLARLKDVLTDKTTKDEFWPKIRLIIGIIFKQVIPVYKFGH